MSGPGIGTVGLTGDQLDAVNAANSPSAANPVATMLDIAGTSNYVHTQSIPATTWNVVHNLGRRVNAQIVDMTGRSIIAEIIWISNNEITVKFNQFATGYVYCN